MTQPLESLFRVYLYDRPVGSLHRKGDFTRFSFDSDYINDPGRAVLGLRFEERLRAHPAANMRLPVWFSNLLPEGRLRVWIGEARQISVEREMELLAEVGHDLPGAVRVLPAEASLASELAASDLEIAEASGARASSRWRFSLAGVGLKFSMLAQGDRFTAPGTGEGGDWIIKLPAPEFSHVPLNELAMMTLAGRAGIEVPDIRLVHRDQLEALPDVAWPNREERAFAIRRFDRGPDRRLIHIEDVAQVRGFYPEGKYRGSYETVAALVYRRRDREALREFARRLAFCILIGNGDAHLKNWSLIYKDPRVPTLSPAYDMVATEIFRPPEWGPELLGLTFGNTKRFDSIGRRSFEALDRALGAKADLADVVTTFVGHVRDQWPLAAQLLSGHGDMQSKLEDLIRHRAERLLR